MANAFSVSVNLVDHVTAPLKAINKQLAAAQAPYKRLSAQISKFQDLSGITALNNGFKAMIGFVERAIGALVRMVPLLGGITGALSLAGMAKLIQSWGDFGTKLLNIGAIIGTSATKLQNMQNAARLAGASADDMTSSIAGLGKAAQDALSGSNKNAAALFQTYGVSFQKSGFQAKSGAELMGSAFDIIKRLKDHGASAAVIQDAMSTLGLSSGMTRFAEQGSAGLAKYNTMAQHFGLLSPQAAEQADNMRFSFSKLQMAVEGFGNAIAEKVSPVLGPLIDQMSELIAKDKDFIASKIAEYVQRIGEWAKGINFKAIFADVKRWTKDVDDIVKSMGGWKRASELLILAWATPKALSMAASILALTRVLTNPYVAALIGGAAIGYTIQHAIGNTMDEMGQAKMQANSEGMVDASPGTPGHYIAPGRGFKYKDSADIYTIAQMAERYRQRNVDDSERQSQSAQDAYSFYLNKNEPGFGPAQAAAMVAQEKAESGFDPSAIGDGGKSRGLYQHSKDRRDAIFHNTGIDVWDPKVAANQHREAAWWELHHTHRAALEAMKGAGDNSGVAGAAASVLFESPKDRIGAGSTRARLSNEYRRSLEVPAPPPLPAASAPGQQSSLLPQQGNLHVVINAPPGFPVSARATGNVLASAPRIVQPMSSYAMG